VIGYAIPRISVCDYSSDYPVRAGGSFFSIGFPLRGSRIREKLVTNAVVAEIPGLFLAIWALPIISMALVRPFATMTAA